MSTSQVIGIRNEMRMDDYDGQMIFGDLVGLKFPDIRLTGEEKPRKKKPHPGNLSRPGIEPRPAAWQACMLPLAPQRWTNRMEFGVYLPFTTGFVTEHYETIEWALEYTCLYDKVITEHYGSVTIEWTLGYTCLYDRVVTEHFGSVTIKWNLTYTCLNVRVPCFCNILFSLL